MQLLKFCNIYVDSERFFIYVPVGISNSECINTLWNDSSQYKKLQICLSALILTANFPVSIENLKQTSQFQTDRYLYQLGSNGRQFPHCSLKILCCLILTETFQLGLKHSESFILPAYHQHLKNYLEICSSCNIQFKREALEPY